MFRLQFRFWLDVTKPGEEWLAEHIAYLKEQRLFSSYIRDGLRLFIDLKAGRIDVLRELFPMVFDSIAAELQAEMDSRRNVVQDQLLRLERLLVEQGNVPIDRPAGPKAMTFSVPDNDDDMPVEMVKDTSTTSAQNFLNSINALVGS